VIVIGLVVMLGLVAWSTSASDEDTKSASLCANYGELVAAGDALGTADLESTTAGNTLYLVDDYLDAVNDVKRAADDRYGQQLDALDQAVADIERTLASVQVDADYSIWQPLVADDVEDALDAAAQVEAVISPSCTPPDL
jgi:hypothetical protein